MARRTPDRTSRISRTFSVRPASELVLALLARAEVQQHEGVAPFRNVRTGLPTLDDAVRSWWGLTLLGGESGIGKTVLAARIALETARAGEEVLWLCAAGNSEGAVFRLLTGLARIPSRAVFVERSLAPPEWSRLASAAGELAGLPLRFVDVHGASVGELGAITRTAAKVRPPELVVLDGLAGLESRPLSDLERLAEETGIPILAVATVDALSSERIATGGSDVVLPLRPGSLLLELVATDAKARPASGPRRLDLELRRVRDGVARRIRLDLDWTCRWIEEHRE